MHLRIEELVVPKQLSYLFLASSQADTDGQFTFKYLITSHSLSISVSPFI